jgi:hypothetical protein
MNIVVSLGSVQGGDLVGSPQDRQILAADVDPPSERAAKQTAAGARGAWQRTAAARAEGNAAPTAADLAQRRGQKNDQ